MNINYVHNFVLDCFTYYFAFLLAEISSIGSPFAISCSVEMKLPLSLCPVKGSTCLAKNSIASMMWRRMCFFSLASTRSLGLLKFLKKRIQLLGDASQYDGGLQEHHPSQVLCCMGSCNNGDKTRTPE